MRIVTLIVLLHAGFAAAGDLIFSDSFEVSTVQCGGGPGPADGLAGNLGPAPSGPHTVLGCVDVHSDANIERAGEIAWGGLPIAQAWGLHDADLDRLALVGPAGQRVAAQFAVVSRWGAPLSDDTAAIRWLEIAFPATVLPNAALSYDLRLYDDPIASVTSLDPFAVVVSAGTFTDISNGVGNWSVNPAEAYLLESITLDPDAAGNGTHASFYQHAAGAGPYLQFDPGSGSVLLDSSTSGALVLDELRVEQSGPVRAVLVATGHLVAADGSSLCTSAGVTAYERFGFTATLVIERASRDTTLWFNLRNECSDAFTAPFDDEAITVERAGWQLPLTLSGTTAVYDDGSQTQTTSATVVRSEQRTGAVDGPAWTRRARVVVDGVDTVTAPTLTRPLVGLGNTEFVALLQMPWMRFREPQAVSVNGSLLDAAIIGEPLVVGEGKALWNVLRLSAEPSNGALATQADQLASRSQLKLERALLPQWPRVTLNEAGLWPGVGDNLPSNPTTAYTRFLDEQHANTIRDDATGQWQRAKTYGSQLWPDTQSADQWVFPADLADQPANNNGAMNYWNPSGAELFEFLRSGEPQWVWDFALPQAWLQIFTARLNIGARDHGLRNGVAVDSGGSGVGHWHRNGGGSDDYTYNVGSHLAYGLQPHPAYRDRLRYGGQMILNRYSVPWNPADPGTTTNPDELATQTDRDIYLNAVMPVRGIFQHFELLANCAEFVPGPAGAACDARLHEIMAEIAHDNLRAGLICQDDVPVDDFCDLPQSFMMNAMMVHFLLRYYLNYGDVQNLDGAFTLSRTLRELMEVFYAQGMDQRPGVGGPDLNGEWAYALGCPLTNAGTTVGVCQRFDTGDGTNMYFANRPHTVALGFIAHSLGGADSLCTDSMRLFDEMFANLHPVTNPYGPLADFVDGGGGWWKGANQIVQMLVFGVGGHDAGCAP